MAQTNRQSSPQRPKGDALLQCLEQLKEALGSDVPGRERDWAQGVERALTCVENALRQHHAAAQAPDGVFAGVDETRPTLARQTDELREDYKGLLEQCLALQKEVRRAASAFAAPSDAVGAVSTTTPRTSTGVVDFGAIRQQGEAFLARLQDNKHAETQLILESVNTDIGVGD
jgi:hypothetical protein